MTLFFDKISSDQFTLRKKNEGLQQKIVTNNESSSNGKILLNMSHIIIPYYVCLIAWTKAWGNISNKNNYLFNEAFSGR